jgi:hypothetical protein
MLIFLKQVRLVQLSLPQSQQQQQQPQNLHAKIRRIRRNVTGAKGGENAPKKVLLKSVKRLAMYADTIGKNWI